MFTCQNRIEIKYLTRLRLEFSHLQYHTFKYDFLDAVVAAAQQLKILSITSFTLPTFQLQEIPFSMKSQLLTDQLLIKMKSKLFNLFFKETQHILSIITN